MKGGQGDVPVAGDHLPPSVIAAHADRRLDSAQAARANEHIAGCPVCHDVFAETLRFSLDEEASEPEAPSSRFAGIARRPMVRWAAGLVVAAGLVLAFPQTWQPGSAPVAPPLLADLAQAMGSKRFVEPRVTGGFQHGRLIVLRSGDRPRGLDEHSPAVLAAVARIRERAEKEDSPATQGALGVTYLVSGDLRAAIKTLESAVEQDPDNARLQSDLSAAYLERARRMDEPADLPKALEAAERSVARPDRPAEAYFNRALALERLHLVDAARKAWNDYLERDPTSGWADEARRHIQELPEARLPTIEEDHARARAALEEGAPAVDRLADESPSILRDYFQHQLLSTWAEAYLAGKHDEALRLRDHAQLIGASLFRTTGDALPRDTALALIQPGVAATAADPLRAQAEGLLFLRDANRLYEIQEPSCDAFRAARGALEVGGSPQACWVRERVVSACLYLTDQQAALTELGEIEAVGKRDGFIQVLGRALWMQGLVHSYRGELSVSLDRYRTGLSSFIAIHDTESIAAVHELLAENLDWLGEGRGAWRERTMALALLERVRNARRRHGLLEEAAIACLSRRTPRAALHFQDQVVADAHAPSSYARSYALIKRAAIHQGLGMYALSTQDLMEARGLSGQITDRLLAARAEAEADAVEGLVLTREHPQRAVAVLRRALAYFERSTPTKVPGLRLDLARAYLSAGEDSKAEQELESGLQLLEAQRDSIRGLALRGSFFESAGALFDEMVRAKVDRRHDPESGLSFVERARALEVAASLTPPMPAKRSSHGESSRSLLPLDAADLARALPPEVALVYYSTRRDDLLSWVVTREGSWFGQRALPSAQLAGMVAAYGAALERHEALHIVHEHASLLYEELVRPLDLRVRSKRVLIVVADGALQSLPFASLWDRQKARYLLEDHVIGAAPSGNVFVQASLAAFARVPGPLAVLAVGNPQLSPEAAEGLPPLPAAETEAVEIAGLYPAAQLMTGAAAGQKEFLAGMRRSRVVHFGGHALGGEAPWDAYLLLAPDPRSGSSGAFYLHALDGENLTAIRAVVLAACGTARAAEARHDSAAGLGRPFLAAGVPNVIASLRDIDDEGSRHFFVAFHRALIADGDPLVALHRTQMAMVRSADAGRSHPASWAVFVSMGGLDRRSLGRLDRIPGSSEL